jgi:hypothetical protein
MLSNLIHKLYLTDKNTAVREVSRFHSVPHWVTTGSKWDHVSGIRLPVLANKKRMPNLIWILGKQEIHIFSVCLKSCFIWQPKLETSFYQPWRLMYSFVGLFGFLLVRGFCIWDINLLTCVLNIFPICVLFWLCWWCLLYRSF